MDLFKKVHIFEPAKSYIYEPDIVRSNTRNVHSSAIPSTAQQLNRRLRPHIGI